MSRTTPVKPQRRLTRSSSNPEHYLARDTRDEPDEQDQDEIHAESSESPSTQHPPPQQIYVLSADGSSLFLLDPTKPTGEEEPPPYAPFRITPPNISHDTECLPASEHEGHAGTGLGITHHHTYLPRSDDAGPSSPIRQQNAPVLYASDHPGGGGDALVLDPSRRRSTTLPGQAQRIILETPNRPRVRNTPSFTRSISPGSRSTRPFRSDAYVSSRPMGMGRSQSSRSIPSARSSPGIPHSTLAVDERTALLPSASASHTGVIPRYGDEINAQDSGVEANEGDDWVQLEYHRGRGRWRAIFCGEVEEGEETRTWKGGWKRYWRTLVIRANWRALAHLVFINFPFALLVWPFLLAGTLAGTALLITLPIGAVVWWLTLFIARSAARFEIITQLHHHSPLSHAIPQPNYHPIFHRLKEPFQLRRTSSSLTSPSSPFIPESNHSFDHRRTSSIEADVEPSLWERRFIRCSYEMFCDHYSYSALVYFLLIKPLVVLFSTIAVIALLPVCVASIVLLPIYLRAARRWGRWQAGIAVANLG